MAKPKENYRYASLKQRVKVEWKIYLLAFVFIFIADNIGQIQIPVGKGSIILFPIFYAIILGVLSGPQVAKIVNNEQVKAASKLVVVGIAPFIAKLGITAGANIETILSAGPAVLLHGFGSLLSIFLALPVAILLGMKREAVGDQLKTFIKQGPKILVVGLLVMTGTFLGSCLWDSLILKLSGAI